MGRCGGSTAAPSWGGGWGGGCGAALRLPCPSPFPAGLSPGEFPTLRKCLGEQGLRLQGAG